MIAGLKPYPAYKPSGLPSLNEVPTHWDVRRAKYFFREADDRSLTGTEELLSVSHITGVTPRSQKNISMFLAESNIGHKLCLPNDVVVNTMWAWMAALGVARQRGIVSPSYAVYRPHPNSGLLPHYADRLLRTPAYAAEYLCASTGINTSRLRLYPEQFLRIPVIRPPESEQALIGRFLNHADCQIRRYIRDKVRLIRLLNEQKKAIVRSAVTRGINPQARLRPSSVDWLGYAPEHWQIGRIKSELQNLNTRRVPLSSTERGRMTRQQYDYYGASGVIDKVDDYLFEDDLLLIAEDGANLVLRNLPLAIIARGRFWVNNHAHILKPRRGSLEYFAALLESIDYSPWISGAAQPKLTQDRLMSVRIPVPPVSEQAAIVSWIEANTRELEAALKKTRGEVDLLGEFRSRLVTDVITGQVDVREAAARLPDAPTTYEGEASLDEDMEESESAELDDAEAEVSA
jgi:type I restriction enzyme, S subunit